MGMQNEKEDQAAPKAGRITDTNGTSDAGQAFLDLQAENRSLQRRLALIACELSEQRNSNTKALTMLQENNTAVQENVSAERAGTARGSASQFDCWF